MEGASDAAFSIHVDCDCTVISEEVLFLCLCFSGRCVGRSLLDPRVL